MTRRALMTFVSAAMMLTTCPLVTRAQEVEVPTAGLFEAPSESPAPPPAVITLAEAIGLTIRRQPRVRELAQAARLASGLHQAERGRFDTTIRVGSGLEYEQQPALPFMLKIETQRREVLDVVADAFTELNEQIRDVASGSTGALPRCPFDIDPDTGRILIGLGLDPGRERTLIFDLIDPDEAALQGNEELPIGAVEIDDSLTGSLDFCTELEQNIEQSRLARLAGDLGFRGVLTSTLQISEETFPMLAELSQSIGTRTRLAWERVGGMPEDTFRRTFSVSGGFTKPFRTGLVVSGSVLLQSEEQNYKGKILDPAFGGMGLRPRFPSQAWLALDVPLGKGLGRDAAAGPERSAAHTAVARQEQLRHTVAEEVYRSLLAYLTLVAAQENVRLLEDSAHRQAGYVTLTEQLVTAEELPKIDLARAQARAASIASALSTARAALAEARVSLAEAAGLDIAMLGRAPLARNVFGELRPSLPAIDDLLQLAGSRRHDTRALQQVREASVVLARAARANLKRTFDFTITGGLSNLYESPFPRFYPDEENPIFSDIEQIPELESPARYYSSRGFYRSMVGRWEPFVSAEITVNFPFGNNAAKGRRAQAESTLRSARIRLADTERVIRQNIVETRNALEASADAVARQREAVEQILKARDASRELFEAGEITLIDTLKTEDDATTDQLELVRQLQLYFSTLARLKFEAGEIVSFVNEGTAAEAVRFTATDFVSP